MDRDPGDAHPGPAPAATALAEPWAPVRYVHQPQACCSCWSRIPKGSPGARVGDRGTRAWFLARAELRCAITGRLLLGPGLWQCLECHAEQTRSELAREGLTQGAGAA